MTPWARSAASSSSGVMAWSESRYGRPSAPGTSSSTPRPTIPSASVITVLRVAPELGTSSGQAAVVHLAAHEHVAERVEVRRPEAVHVGADEVAGGLVARDAGGLQSVAAREHVVLRREGLLGVGRERQVVGQADGDADSHVASRRARAARASGTPACRPGHQPPSAPRSRLRRKGRRALPLWARSQREKLAA